MENTGDNTGESACAAESPELRAQGHGGALKTGNPGNKGGMGRPTNEIREIARQSYAVRIPILEQIADGTIKRVKATEAGPVEEEPSFKERIQAIAELGKVGIGSKVEVDAPINPLVVGLTVGPEVAEERRANGLG